MTPKEKKEEIVKGYETHAGDTGTDRAFNTADQ
jgi:ribosomal protein S15P/S13E